jgi:hypothetical protein
VNVVNYFSFGGRYITARSVLVCLLGGRSVPWWGGGFPDYL